MTEPEFKHLLERYLNGSITENELVLLEKYYDSFQAEANTLSRYTLQQLKSKSKRSLQHHLNLRATKKLWDDSALFKIAATIIFSIGVGFLTYHNRHWFSPEHRAKYITYATGPGERMKVTLPEGTQILLHANSQMVAPKVFSDTLRKISLQGEAFFKVAKDSVRPFQIETKGLLATVLGTEFAMKQEDGRAEVILVEGSIRVANKTGAQESIVLLPNQQVLLNLASNKLETKTVDASRLTAWRDGVIEFNNVTIQEALGQLEKWYGVSFQVMDKRVLTCEISAKYKNERLEHVLRSFRFMTKLEYTRLENRVIVITGKGCRQ